MIRRLTLLLVAILLPITTSATAGAQNPIPLAEAQQAIRGISAEIDSGRLRGAELVEALLNRAYLYANTGQLGRAKQDVEAVLRADRRNADAYYIQGLTSFVGNPGAAAASFAKVIQLEEGSARGYRARAWSHLSDERYGDAMQDFERALRLEPHGEAMRGLGWAQLQAKRYDAAVGTFTDLLQHSPRDADALAARGLAHFLAGRAGEARTDFRSAMRFRPNDPDRSSRHDNTVYLQDWKRYRRLGEVVEARVRRDASDPDAWLALGVLYYHGGGLDLAPFARAASLRPDDVDALMFRGLYHSQVVFDRDQAIAAFTAAIEADPKHAEAHFRRALVRAVDPESMPEAIADIERALALSPGEPVLIQVRDRFRAKHRAWQDAKSRAARARAEQHARAIQDAQTFWSVLGFLLLTHDGSSAPVENYVGSSEYWIDVFGPR